MIPMLGRAAIRVRGAHVRHFAPLAQKLRPAISANTVRAFTTQTVTETTDILQENILRNPLPTKEEFLKRMDGYELTGNVTDATYAVQKAHDHGVAEPEYYRRLVDIIAEAPFDTNFALVVAYWFSNNSSKLPEEIRNDLAIWKEVLQMAFGFGSNHESNELRNLLNKFTEIFNLDQLDDQESWELLIKGWSILGREDKTTDYFTKFEDSAKDKVSFLQNALVCFAITKNEEKAKEVLEKLKTENGLSYSVLERVAKVYAFRGSLEKTSYYLELAKELEPANENYTLLLVAHKKALKDIVYAWSKTRGPRGFDLLPKNSPKYDSIQASWEILIKEMMSRDVPMDIVECNTVLEYMACNNRLDPKKYPMEDAEAFLTTYMPKNDIKPNNVTYQILLHGYSLTRQFGSEGHTKKLDAVLKLLARMKGEGIKVNQIETFHSLFRACVPPVWEKYIFDYYKSTALLSTTNFRRTSLDPRIFEIEKIMLEARVPHDAVTFRTMLTCIAAAGLFDAFNSRWYTLRRHGIRPDRAMYQRVFELCALDAEQSKFAVRQVKADMLTDFKDVRKIDVGLNCAILNCCVTGQLTQEAEITIEHIQKKMKKEIKNNPKWLDANGSRVYAILLRASVLIRGLSSNKIVREIKELGIEYNRDIWEALLSKYAVENDHKAIRRLFNQYTMARFEQQGLIPIPAREGSPVIPFPSGPYNSTDINFINVYLGSLLDTQNLSLVFDVLRTYTEQSLNLGVIATNVIGAINLAKKEKDLQNLKWLETEALSKSTGGNYRFKKLAERLEKYNQTHQ
ncbi:hypothetical protein BY458DRAFT_161373 [Sporodiniella umbellata]|nr:hypothetical protein BY458DRAFT_161373 [Sporodiniella umbellata]